MKDPIKELRLGYYKCIKTFWHSRYTPKDIIHMGNIREALKTFDPDWDRDHWLKISMRIRNTLEKT